MPPGCDERCLLTSVAEHGRVCIGVLASWRLAAYKDRQNEIASIANKALL